MKSSPRLRCHSHVRRSTIARALALFTMLSAVFAARTVHAENVDDLRSRRTPPPEFLRAYMAQNNDTVMGQPPPPPPTIPYSVTSPPPMPQTVPPPSATIDVSVTSPPPPPQGYARPFRVRGRRDGVTWEASIDARASYISALPQMQLNQDVSGLRNFASGTTVRGTSPLVLGGVGFDFGLVIDDRWRIGGLGGAYEAAMGSFVRRAATVNGSVAQLRPWTADRFSFDVGGIGQRFKYRRWMFSWFASMHVFLTDMNLSIAESTQFTDASASAVAFGLRGQLEACRRIDLEARLCLAVAPDIFNGGYWLNGGTVAARWEWGK